MFVQWLTIISFTTQSSLLGSGEHGIGYGKKEFLVEELGAGTVRLMKAVKNAIDPLNLFNPGKVCNSLAVQPFSVS
jgi:hypothetical protein